MRTTLLAALLSLTVAAPAFAYGTRTFEEMATHRDVGREAFHSGGGTPLPVRPQALAREQMPTGLPGWTHDGTDLVSNGQAAYPVLTQTAIDHPTTSLSQGTALLEEFPDARRAPGTFAGNDDMAFEG